MSTNSVAMFICSPNKIAVFRHRLMQESSHSVNTIMNQIFKYAMHKNEYLINKFKNGDNPALTQGWQAILIVES